MITRSEYANKSALQPHPNEGTLPSNLEQVKTLFSVFLTAALFPCVQPHQNAARVERARLLCCDPWPDDVAQLNTNTQPSPLETKRCQRLTPLGCLKSKMQVNLSTQKMG